MILMNDIIAVTGITGHTGNFFLKELIDNHYTGKVRCLVRRSSDTTLLDQSGLDIEKIYGDANDETALKTLVRNAGLVLHIANIHYSISVLKACMEESVSRVILVHTTGIYSKYKMASKEYEKIEEELRELEKKSTIETIILRPTMIFGDMCDHNIHKFIRMVDKFPLMPEISHGRGKIQPVNARDLGRAFYQVCIAESLPSDDYILSGERALSLHELFDMIGGYLGKKTRHISVPLMIGKIGAKVVRIISFGKIDYVERVLRMGEDRDFEHGKATEDFGYTPEPFEDGLKREVEQYLLRKRT